MSGPKQQCLAISGAVQDVDDFDEARSDPVEDQIARVDTPADAVMLKAGNERTAERCSRDDDFRTGAQALPARR